MRRQRWWLKSFREHRPFSDDDWFAVTLIIGVVILCGIDIVYGYWP